ncbi:exocyst complex component 1-like [Protopterus annectens]|uniref:exocyst complex component 1-like n=1 Tax=Protopterus annectens TaxID=7888 RepID=UPI001CFBB2F3|nr:exocyst complex component 1-like [Protopterus annectens]
MGSIRGILQRELFTPHEERLLTAAHVRKPGKRRKGSILCAVVSAERPVQVSLVKVKKSDRGDQYKQASKWSLKELKVVDGKDTAEEIPSFDLHLDKIYKWIASSACEKNAFITCLWKLNQRYLHHSARFINVGSIILEEHVHPADSRRVSVREDEEEEEEEEEDDYQELTLKESADIERLMEECQHSIANAEAFTERLSRDLEVLDEANIQSIISSEEQVTSLMELIEEALAEVSELETTMQLYEDLLSTVKEQMDQLHHSNSQLQLVCANHQKLTQEAFFLTLNLDLSTQHREILRIADFSSIKKINACIVAVEALSRCMNTALHPGQRKLHAVAEQLIKLESLRQNFEKTFITHISKIFIQQGIDLGSALTQQSGNLNLPTHTPYHEDLLQYKPLMAWLKTTNSALFWDLPKVYAENLKKLYEKQIKEFFELAKNKLAGGKDSKRFSLSEGFEKITGSTSSLQKFHHRLSITEVTAGDLGELERGKVDKILEQVLMQLEPICMKEEEFLAAFFGNDEQETNESLQSETFSRRKAETSTAAFEESEIKAGRLTACMEDMLGIIEPELRSFVNQCDKVHVFSAVQVLMTLTEHVLRCQNADSSSFLNAALRKILLQAKRNFDKCISALIKDIEDYKLPKKNKIGILTCVTNFEEFVNMAEDIFQSAKQRGDLDKAYGRLIAAVFSSIEKLESSHLKSSSDVVMMENFHRIFCFLAERKIASLEPRKKEAKQKYTQYLNSYIKMQLGQPLEKLNHFFDGVRGRVAQGVKDDEVSFQLAYSKQELRKVIDKYPGKEVKKSLELVYKKILKHLSEEENLILVVWRAMEQEFLQQYKDFDSLMSRCYSGSGITLDFTVDDLLQYFSIIPQSSIQ